MNKTFTSKIELNPQFKRALDLIEKTKRNVFVTGKAGTGKSTLLQLFRAKTKKKLVVLAPTGVAALNVQGQTIHSFFGFKPDITPFNIKQVRVTPRKKKLLKKLETIIIDEVSMVRADLLDCVDGFLRLYGPKKNQPFGGAQMIFIGDLYQLPPVVTSQEKSLFTPIPSSTNNSKISKNSFAGAIANVYGSPYFFDAKSFPNLSVELIELEKIYRQKDQRFIELLNSIRNNSAGEAELKIINQRLNQKFESQLDDFYIYLTPTNALASSVNNQKLEQLKTKVHHYKGFLSGKFDVRSLPTDMDLNLKVGAQVMLLNNDASGRWINGTIGKIVDIETDDEQEDAILVELASGDVEAVYPYTWKMFEFKFNPRTGEIESDTLGSFTQYPMKLAWAITIHKSQGKTFNKVILDIGRGTFAHGQLYVALSRCVSLEGLVLKKPLVKHHIWMDWRVVKFVTSYQYQISAEKCSTEDKIKIIEQAIAENRELEITYLKNNDSKSKRLIKPQTVGEMEYLGKTYLGLEAFCLLRHEDRVFRVDRILEMRMV
ncbi:AAA family ATPase [Patescibacteria group bacterium]|nr:AAA family ATPase [Patescibacteria group bacterium]MBU4512379.1 AAA family ATPase [Patescibacteria group bacterium]MCG2692488.1 AAA family ATPase [Candidatus Parcubacteria bacterium]